jgi:PIN domain nuclease of toxin-antitoxin system
VNLLIDTHILLWWEWQARALSEVMRTALRDPENRLVVSAATVWEISMKRKTGRLDFDGDTIAACKASNFDFLPITAEHAELAGALPLHHTDPFDRMLVAQAKIEALVLLTQDRKLLGYGVPILGLE